MIKVAFIGTKNFPIPNIRGGAIETLITGILDENEKKHQLDLTVFTIESEGLDDYIKKYHYTKFSIIKNPSTWLKTMTFMRRMLRKLTDYRVHYKSSFMTYVNRIMNQDHFDVVVYENEAADMMQARRYKDTKNVMHIHADYITADMPGVELLCQHCDCVVGVSDFIRNKMEEISYLKGRGRTLKNAIDLTLFSEKASDETIKGIRQTLGLSNDDIVVLYCGRLSKEKGCLELIKAVEKVPNVKLLVIGGENFDSNKKTKYVGELLKEAKKIEERIVFTGYVSHDEVKKYYATADIGVVPSICNEAASLTLLEYRASGLPTIASRMGGIPEYCNDNTTILVEYNDAFIENLAIAVQKLAEDKKLRNRLSSYARVGLEDYGYTAYYDNFVELMKNLSHEHKGVIDGD